MRPKLLDLFCGAGGAAMGYHRAGFDVVGVDIVAQPRYPFAFIQGDALNPPVDLQAFDVIHASPPCQAYTSIRWANRLYADLIPATRELLQASGRPFVIENVPGAPLNATLILCGTMFGLDVIRHRYFETDPPLLMSPASCAHLKPVVKHGRPPDWINNYAGVTGHFSDVKFAQQAMAIDWMRQQDLAQAIPPAYTEWIGQQLIERVN